MTAENTHITVVREEVRTDRVLRSTLTIGRSSSNDIVLPEAGVSGHHAMLWLESGCPWVRDLGSKNGTFLDGELLTAAAALEAGSVVKVGETMLIVDSVGEDRAVLLERTGSRVRYAVPPTGLSMGREDADLKVEQPARVEVLPTSSGVTVADGESIQEVPFGETFVVGKESFCVVLGDSVAGATVADSTAPYILSVGLSPPSAILTDRTTGSQVEIVAENRVSLLYFLAQQPKGNWVDESDVIVGVWGRAGLEESGQKLTALIFRVRQAARQSGLDDDFLLRRHGAVCLNIQGVEVR